MRWRVLRRSFLGGTVAWLSLGAAIAAGEVATRPDASDDLFTNAVVRHLRLEITPQDMGKLRQTVARHRSQAERPSVPATVREGELVWTNVSLHLKGAAGNFRSVDDKPALTLNFDKLADGQRFHGLQKISLNNSVQDSICVHEKSSSSTGQRMPRRRCASEPPMARASARARRRETRNEVREHCALHFGRKLRRRRDHHSFALSELLPLESRTT